MKRHSLYAFMAVLAAGFCSCSEETEPPRFNDGKLHLLAAFNANDETRWSDDGNQGTRSLPAIPLSSDEMPNLELYLYGTDEWGISMPDADTVAQQTVTRGKRITGEVFESDYTSYGLYAKLVSSSDDYLLDMFEPVAATGGLQTVGIGERNGDWYEGTAVLTYPAGGWGDTDKGQFYAYTPVYSGVSVSVDDVTHLPTMTFTMDKDEANNKDVLSAYNGNVTKTGKDEGIQLQFQHILSAVKFTQPDGGMVIHYKHNDGTTSPYYVEITGIKLGGIYTTGTYIIGSSAPADRTAEWTVDGAQTTGTCTSSAFTPSGQDLNGDDHCFMVLPQTLPEGAYVEFTCNLHSTSDLTSTTNIVSGGTGTTFRASLAGKVWKAGHTYRYKVTDMDYVFKVTNLSNLTAPFSVLGTADDEREFTVESYAISGNVQTPVKWSMNCSADGGSTYELNLPSDFVLMQKNASNEWEVINPADMGELEGAVENQGKTFKMVALKHIEKLTAVQRLRKVKYPASSAEGEYHDLSLYSIDGLTKISRSTANCYIVNGYGKFKFPLVFGNAIKDGETNSSAYAAVVSASKYLLRSTSYTVFVDYQGNQISGPSVIPDGTDVSTLSAAIVWMDEQALIAPTSIKIGEESDGLYYCYFEIPQNVCKEGNAILAVRDNTGTIMWSWHIWVTSINVASTVPVTAYVNSVERSVDFSRVNLGWRRADTYTYSDPRTFKFKFEQNFTHLTDVADCSQNAGTVDVGGSSLYYQFGRKDPMPGRYNLGDGTTVDMATSQLYYPSGTAYTWGVNHDYTTMENSIQHPQILYSPTSEDWEQHGRTSLYSSAAYFQCRWDRRGARYDTDATAFELIKTVYDPCPVGFTVPPLHAFTLLSVWGASPIDDTENDANIRGVRFS